jgi:hypothetical protein
MSKFYTLHSHKGYTITFLWPLPLVVINSSGSGEGFDFRGGGTHKTGFIVPVDCNVWQMRLTA